ncbi:MAG: potassium channel family protein [Arcobacter sp.]|uniref:potassium channel family protein n=1 Tax=Arcobacter sp. TaxID=1872629 RepID=UPI003AFFB629
MEFKRNLYFVLERPDKHKYGMLVQFVIYANIFLSILVLFLESEVSLKSYSYIFDIINEISIIIFTIEYISRVYSINYMNNCKRSKYIFTPFMIIDLLVLLPFYLSFLNIDLTFLRTLRILRIFKLFRLAKFIEFDNILADIVTEKKEEFIFILIASVIILFTIAPLVFYFEHDVQPTVFKSMLDALWWSVVTFTTVGYGDMYPVTGIGRILATFLGIFGIAFYAIPGSILTSAFLDKMNHKKHDKEEKNLKKNNSDDE